MKEWIPLIAISFFLIITPPFVVSMTHNFYQILPYKYYQTLGTEISLSVLGVVISSTVLAALLALFVESYRFQKIKTDFYYSLPFKEKELRRIRTLTALIILLLVFSLSYWMPLAIYYVRYGLASAPVVNTSTNTTMYAIKERMVDPSWLFLGYLSSLLFLSSSFFLSSFFVRLGNSLTSSVLILLGGSVAFAALFPALALWLSIPINSKVGGEQIDFVPMAFQTYGVSAPGFSFAAFFLEPILYGTNLKASTMHAQIIKNPAYLTSFIISLLISLSLGGLSAYILFSKEDPSGEWSGQPGSYREWSRSLIFAALSVFALLSSLLGFASGGGLDAFAFASYFVLAIFFASIQYVVYLLYEKKAALSKRSWIFFGIAQGLSLMLFFVEASLS